MNKNFMSVLIFALDLSIIMQNISKIMHQNCFPKIKLLKKFGKNLGKRMIIFRDGRAAYTQFHQPGFTATDFDNVVYVCDSRLAIVKMIVAMKYTSGFLNATVKLNTALSVLERCIATQCQKSDRSKSSYKKLYYSFKIECGQY